MKIVITGANGMLAKAVIERFKKHELILTDVTAYEKLDITNLEEVETFISNTKPDAIINCAAYTAVDNAEIDLELARKINAQGPKNLAIASNKNNCIFVHISTDYVFGGSLPLQNEYKEDDEKAPETVYGVTKLEGEEFIKENTNNYYVFRTAWLYGDGKNFVRTMLAAGRKKENEDNEEDRFVTVVADQHGSPTYTVDLADIIYQALEKEIPFGIYNATDLGFTTWYEFTKEIYEISGVKCRVKPLTTEEYTKNAEKAGKKSAKRPANSKMSKSKLLNLGINIPYWKDALERYLKSETSRN